MLPRHHLSTGSEVIRISHSKNNLPCKPYVGDCFYFRSRHPRHQREPVTAPLLDNDGTAVDDVETPCWIGCTCITLGRFFRYSPTLEKYYYQNSSFYINLLSINDIQALLQRTESLTVEVVNMMLDG